MLAKDVWRGYLHMEVPKIRETRTIWKWGGKLLAEGLSTLPSNDAARQKCCHTTIVLFLQPMFFTLIVISTLRPKIIIKVIARTTCHNNRKFTCICMSSDNAYTLRSIIASLPLELCTSNFLQSRMKAQGEDGHRKLEEEIVCTGNEVDSRPRV